MYEQQQEILVARLLLLLQDILGLIKAIQTKSVIWLLHSLRIPGIQLQRMWGETVWYNWLVTDTEPNVFKWAEIIWCIHWQSRVHLNEQAPTYILGWLLTLYTMYLSEQKLWYIWLIANTVHNVLIKWAEIVIYLTDYWHCTQCTKWAETVIYLFDWLLTLYTIYLSEQKLPDILDW